ncbi:MAG: ATP synthase F1 subunit delta [Thainema sp.]
MQDSIITSEVIEPYAQAYMSLAKEHDLVDRFSDDVSAILQLLSESEDLRRLVESPMIKPDVKKSVIRQVFSEQLHAYTLNFLLLLVDRGRLLFLSGICRQYQALVRKLKGIALAEVKAAVQLTADQEEQIRQKVQSFTGAQSVDLEVDVDPNLLGGVIIKVGSRVIDASLRGQLRKISNQLMKSSA